MHTGVFTREIGTDASGRWSTHIGAERGNTIVEVQQKGVGRPWSGWSKMIIQQLPAFRKPKYRPNELSTRSYIWLGNTRSTCKSTCTPECLQEK